MLPTTEAKMTVKTEDFERFRRDVTAEFRTIHEDQIASVNRLSTIIDLLEEIIEKKDSQHNGQDSI
jgi:hypothetical protein